MLSGGANRWTDWVKEFASKNNLSYGCALSTPACKEEYRAKYGSRKKLTKTQEKELMGMEDKPQHAPVKKAKKSRAKKAKKIVLDEETAQEVERERMMSEEETGKANKKARHREKVVEMKSKLNKNLALKGIVEKGKELQERNEMGAEDINRAVKKIKVKKPKQNIQLIIEEDSEDEKPAVKKRGRPKKYATTEEARQMKIKKTIEASKRRQAKKREEKAEAKASKKKPKLIIEDDGEEDLFGELMRLGGEKIEKDKQERESKKGKGFNPLPDFKEQVASAEGGMINPLSDPAFAKEYAEMKAERTGGHWTPHLKPHLINELSNYENIAHHLGQHLHEKGAKDPKDITGFHHFSREADRVRKLLARI
jgi:hypothetical protein